MKESIVVWFSCGAASAVAAKLTLEKYGNDYEINIVNNPVKEEDEDNRRFLRDVEKWIDHDIIIWGNKDYPNNSAVEIWDKRKYMSGVKGAPCTMLLKKEARYQYELTHEIDWHVLGFTYEEKNRFDRFIWYERHNTLPVLIEAKITKSECFEIIINAGLKLPEIYSKGFPNANCIGCVKSSSPTYWNLVRKQYPQVFEKRKTQSMTIGTKLVKYKGKRIYLSELPVTTKKGKINSVECGLFCGET